MQVIRPLWMSEEQWQIVNARKMGASYDYIISQYQLSNREALCRCLTRSALGLPWCRNYAGGSDPYLCSEDQSILIQDIMDGIADLNCLSKSQVIDLAHTLKINRALLARRFLLSLGCPKLSEKIDLTPPEPGKGWLFSFCEQNNISMVWRENLEEIRRVQCTSARIK